MQDLATIIEMNKRKLSDKAQKFLAKKPTLIGSVAGSKFYEHPTGGDESPLIEITPQGTIILTGWWDLPTVDELSN